MVAEFFDGPSWADVKAARGTLCQLLGPFPPSIANDQGTVAR